MSDYTSEIPYGYCHCGCGQKTRIATANNKENGHIKGEPVRYIKNHRNTVTLMQSTNMFWSHVNKDGSFPLHCPELGQCWEWTAYLDEKGYGRRTWKGKQVRTHRIAWMITYGEIPKDLCVLHKCDNPKCVRPDHLFLGTNHDNVLDRVSKNRSNRPYGEKSGMHKLTKDQVIEIRQRYALGNVSQNEPAHEYNISYANLNKIINRRLWQHVS